MKMFLDILKNPGSYGTSHSKEFIAGMTTFLTMSYIIIVNPALISGNTDMPFTGVLTATILVSALSSILMGVYANLPYALAPGMGINAFFAITLVSIHGVPWTTALGTVFISGLIFILLSALKVRDAIVKAIPLSLRSAIAGGIGLFIAMIGFKNADFIVNDPFLGIKLGSFDIRTVLFLIGLLISVFFILKKVSGALLLGIIITTAVSIPFGRMIFTSGDTLIRVEGSVFTLPDLSVFFRLNIKDALKLGMMAPLFTFLFTDLFDSLSTFVGISQVSGMVDKDGNPKNIGRALMVDAISTTISGLFGTSSGTTYIESAAGIEEGGKTGLTACYAGLLFLPFLFLGNLVQAIPVYATAPALVIVGVYMMQGIKTIDFKDFEEGIPAFLAMILIPLTYSITQGIIWGFLSYTVIKILRGKFKDIPITMYIITLFSILALVFSH